MAKLTEVFIFETGSRKREPIYLGAMDDDAREALTKLWAEHTNNPNDQDAGEDMLSRQEDETLLITADALSDDELDSYQKPGGMGSGQEEHGQEYEAVDVNDSSWKFSYSPKFKRWFRGLKYSNGAS